MNSISSTQIGVLSAVGNTPLVRLSRLEQGRALAVYAKLESANPGGSMKDRSALEILKEAISTGSVKPGGIVIESSSGNMAIGLAQACLYYGIRLICVVDVKATQQNLRILQAYGAEIEMVTKPDPETGEYLKARIERVGTLLRDHPGAFWPDQYSNLANPRAHHQTMAEIADALDRRVDFVFCATSTCGTMRGCAEYIQAHNLPAKIIAVDAVGSVIFGGERKMRLIPGHGAGVRPRLFDSCFADRFILVSDEDCVLGCHRLVNLEAILAGGSSGAIVAAFERARPDIPDGAVCVLILADRGERYLDTIYSRDWVRSHFGDILDGLDRQRSERLELCNLRQAAVAFGERLPASPAAETALVGSHK